MDAGPELRRIKVSQMLADHAEVADGKLFINGGGWTLTGPAPSPFAIAMTMEVPREWANSQLMIRWELLDDQGHGVLVPGMMGMEPMVIQGQLGLGEPHDAPDGVPITAHFAINVGPVPLHAGSRYEWRLMINDETHEDWRLGFNTRSIAQSDVG